MTYRVETDLRTLSQITTNPDSWNQWTIVGNGLTAKEAQECARYYPPTRVRITPEEDADQLIDEIINFAYKKIATNP